MKKKFDIVNVDCANCAAKMENAIKRIEGVTDAKLNFFAQKLIIEAEESDFDNIINQANNCVKKVDSDAYIEFGGAI